MNETAEIRLRWLIEAHQDPSSLTVADIEAIYNVPKEWRDWTPEREIDFLTNGPHSGSRPLTVQRVTVGEEHSATAILVGADGKRFAVTCWSETEEPHRLTGARTAPAGPDGMEIRLATADDGAVLAELERRAPLRLGTDPLTFMTFDRGDDYFAASRLMEEVTIYVAEHEGKIVGVYCGAVQPVEVGGETKRLFLEHHVRIDPEAPRGGVFWALCAYGREHYARSTDSIAFYVSVDNHALRKLGNLTPGWSPQPLRTLLPCSVTDATGDVARFATASDAPAIVDVLNGCHTGSALFAPYTVESLTARPHPRLQPVHVGRHRHRPRRHHRSRTGGGEGDEGVRRKHRCLSPSDGDRQDAAHRRSTRLRRVMGQGIVDRLHGATSTQHLDEPGHPDDAQHERQAPRCEDADHGGNLVT